MRDQASGIVVMCVFGAVWWAVGCTFLTAPAGPILLAAGAVVTLLLLAAWWRLRRTLPASAPDQSVTAGVSRRFAAVNAAEWVAIALVVIGARAVDHAELIPALVCLVVCVHFFPLAGLFDVPRDRLTGGALVIVAAATLITMLLPDLSAATDQAAASFGAALVLWATSSSWVGPFARA